MNQQYLSIYNISFPTRLSDCHNALVNNEHIPIDDFILNHSALALYSPFVSPTVINKQITFLSSGASGAVANELGANNNLPYKTSLSFCPECALDEISLYGYTYWHRTHQVIGVDVCHKHLCRLVEIPMDSVKYSHYLPSDFIKNNDYKAVKDSPNLYLFSYSNFVESALNKQITYKTENRRVSAYSLRFEEVTGRPFTPQNIHRLLIKHVGTEHLEKIRLSPYQFSTLNWPISFIDRTAYIFSPFVNLLFISLLFDNVNSYNAYLSCVPDIINQVPTKFTKHQTAISTKLIKDLLSIEDKRSIAKSHNMTAQQLNRLLALHPSINERRIQSLLRQKINNSKEIILRAISDTPNINQRTLRDRELVAFRTIRKYDQKWLDSLLPRTKSYTAKNRNRNYQEHLRSTDMLLSNMLLIWIRKEKADLSKSIWINKTYIYNSLSSHESSLIKRGKLPLTKEVIDQHYETQNDFENRLTNLQQSA